MYRYLIDTNIISEALKPIPANQVINRLEQYKYDIAICTPVWHELLFGLYRLPSSDKRNKLKHYLYDVVGKLPLFAYNQDAAEWHAKERARLTKIGKTPPFCGWSDCSNCEGK